MQRKLTLVSLILLSLALAAVISLRWKSGLNGLKKFWRGNSLTHFLIDLEGNKDAAPLDLTSFGADAPLPEKGDPRYDFFAARPSDFAPTHGADPRNYGSDIANLALRVSALEGEKCQDERTNGNVRH